ncbi:MAG: helix-turn-helix domain-containing protein [Nitrosopumilus sp.]
MNETTTLADHVTTRDIADMHGVGVRDVQYYIKRGVIRATKVGYFYLVHNKDVPKNWPPQ